MELSIIIVNWNTRGLVLRCLNHLTGLDLPLETEVWVVDNGSTDGSPEAIRSSFPDVHLLENSRNMGFARANNQALKRAQGRYILLLNTDCFPHKGAIQALIGAMERHPEAGIAGGKLRHPDGRPQNSFGVAPTLATELIPKGLLETLLPRRFPSKRRPPHAPMEVETVTGAFLLVRREALECVGGLDESYFFFLEETDWCLRMRKAGWVVLHVPGAEALHLQGGSAVQELARARVEYYRSRYRFFALHRGGGSLALLRWGLLLKGLANWISSGILAYLWGSRGSRWEDRHAVDGTLLRWHLSGCPEDWGLSGRHCQPVKERS